MKGAWVVAGIALLVGGALGWAQTPGADPEGQLAEHLSQLMESTAVAVPGLVNASEPVRKLAGAAVAEMRAAPRDLAVRYRFGKLVGAYLALSDTFARPQPFPPTAEQQFSELRDGAQKWQARFETSLRELNREAQARDADPVDLARYADADAKLAPPGVAPRVVFLGDSITEGWRLNEYFTGRDFVNRGISGETTLQMLGRFPRDVVALRPKAVLILGGTNDIARGIRPAEIEDNLTMMGELAKANGIMPVFGSILPVSDYHRDVDPQFERTRMRPAATVRQVNDWLRDYCRKEGFTLVDFYAAMADGGGQMPADMADDGLHPNAKGYRAMAPLALDGLNKALTPTVQPVSGKSEKKRFGLLGK